MRQNFSEDEWVTLLQAPMQAVVAVCLADKVDPVSFLQELKAGVKLVSEATSRSDLPGDLVPALLKSTADLDSQDPLSGEQLQLKKQFELLGLIQTFKNANEGKNAAISHFQKVAALLAAKVTGVEANSYKTWLMSLAEKVAEAQKEGGIMGLGASRISERESDVLKQLAMALGL
ncbi:MAG: hypothetical protein VKO01_01265 [Cyanobacteriota bacterium]|nr:hypothetical protein [Cyanobacteriota bacterium]